MNRTVICDIETDDLNPRFVWVIVCLDVDTKEKKTFIRPDLFPEEFLEYAKGVTKWVGHNFLAFDYNKVLRVFFPSLTDIRKRIIDTLILSRLVRFDMEGGHSVAAYAKRFGKEEKVAIENFAVFTDEIVRRCESDVGIQFNVYKLFEKYIQSNTWAQAIQTEHELAWISEEMSAGGFGFDYEGAIKLRSEIQQRVDSINELIQSYYPPDIVTTTFVPKVNSTKFGYSKGVPVQRETIVPFNPGSPKQVVQKLNEAGWKPEEKTKGHIKAEQELRRCRDKAQRQILKDKLLNYKEFGWAVSEDNLATLPPGAPEGAKRLAEWITLAARVRSLTEWIESYNPVSESIHPTFLSIGSWTHRMAHQNPNSANIPGHYAPKDKKNPTPVEQIKLDYNLIMRQLWRARKGRKLVGVDADGIQLRILAHATNDMDLAKALVNGNKADRTDAHSLNALRLGIGYDRRDDAKTFIYAWVLGASASKVAEILKCSVSEAKQKVEEFLESSPSLREFKKVLIPKLAGQGYFQGVDGRYVAVPDEHRVLAGILQNGEKIVMSTANVIWREELSKQKIPFWQVNFVHDEWQTETLDDEDIAKEVGRIQADAIREAGERLNLRCPMLGSVKIGYNWKDTH